VQQAKPPAIVNKPAEAAIPKKETNGGSEAAKEDNEKTKEKKEKSKKKEKKEKKEKEEETETNGEKNVEVKSDNKEKRAKKEKTSKVEATSVASSTEPQTNGVSSLEPKVKITQLPPLINRKRKERGVLKTG
jgi:hypothetical protein